MPSCDPLLDVTDTLYTRSQYYDIKYNVHQWHDIQRQRETAGIHEITTIRDDK